MTSEISANETNEEVTPIPAHIVEVSAPKKAKTAVKQSKAAKSAKSAAKAAPKSKPHATHPLYIDMVKKAIGELKERKGSSKAAILKYILQHYNVGENLVMVNKNIRQTLNRGVETGALIQSKGTGAAGSFRLPAKVSSHHATTNGGNSASNNVAGDEAASVGGTPKRKPAPKKSAPKRKAAAKKSAVAAAPVEESEEDEQEEEAPEPAAKKAKNAPEKRAIAASAAKKTTSGGSAAKAPAKKDGAALSRAPISKQQIRALIFYEWRLGGSARAAAGNICDIFGADTVTHTTVNTWFNRFREGDTALDDRPHTGRPPDLDDNVLRGSVDERPNATIRDLATALGCSHTTIKNRLHVLGYRKILAQWTPYHHLSDANKQSGEVSGVKKISLQPNTL